MTKMKKLLLFIIITLTTLTTSVFAQTTFTSTSDLQTAVDLWVSDQSAATTAHGDINTWNVSAITDMSSLFNQEWTFNSDISNWDVGSVTNMSYMFANADAFTQDISGWDVSSVTNMTGIFYSSALFNGDISGWDVSSVTTMNSMFYSASTFNQDLPNWDVSSVTDMRSTFQQTTNFNGDLTGWNTSSVTLMYSMFNEAIGFNGDVSNFDVSGVTNMSHVFFSCTSFDQDISLWDISNVTGWSRFFYNNSGFSDENKCLTYTGLIASNANFPFDYSSSCTSTSSFVISSDAGAGWRLLSPPINVSYANFLGDLWLQGCTGGDTDEGSPNVFSWNASGQSWTSITNCNSTITRGTLVLVYVFQDTDNDGDNDLSKTITTYTNTTNGITSESSISSGEYIGLGNPFSSAIDWDLVNRFNSGSNLSIQPVMYIYDTENSSWLTFTSGSDGTGTDGQNGTGTPTDGIIAPYQGFFVKSNITNSAGSNETKSNLIIDTGDLSIASFSFLGRDNNNAGSAKFIVTTDNSSSTTFLNFNQWGEIGKDMYDADSIEESLEQAHKVVELTRFDLYRDKVLQIVECKQFLNEKKNSRYTEKVIYETHPTIFEEEPATGCDYGIGG